MTARRVRLLISAGLLAVAAAGALEPVIPRVLVGRVDTAIQPASALYLKKLVRRAEAEQASLLVVALSTPGGLMSSMREMASTILVSKVPVATFVSPSGSQAASAGFFLLLAGDVAAMAPGTNAGAAHPVGGQGEDLPKAMNEKAEQDARAFIRSIAAQRGRNADKAEAAVAKSVSYTESEARDAGLIDLVARDVPDLLAKLEGRTLSRGGAAWTTLSLKKAVVEAREMSKIERLLGVVADPNVAYLLFLAGLLGVYFELSNPGSILPGIVGGIALLLALYAFSVLPVNLAGLALILFAIALFVAEVKVASHGLLAAGGAVALVAGTALLFSGRDGAQGYEVDLSIILPALAVTLAVVGFLTWNTLRLRRRPVTTGAEGLVGEEGKAVRGFEPPEGRGTILVHGEYWEAEGAPGAAVGEALRVVRVEDFRLRVERRT